MCIRDRSLRVENGIITDLKTESPRKNNLRKLLIGYPFSDWVSKEGKKE